MKEKGYKTRSLVFIIVVMLFISLLSLTNMNLLREPLASFMNGSVSFEKTTKEIARSYTSDAFRQKKDFLNLNGLYARVTGRRVYNKVIKLDNGMITQIEHAASIPELAESIADFSDEMKESGIEYLYMQAPYKCDINGELLPTGVIDYGNQFSNELLRRLEERNVRTYDLRQDISATPEDVERYFFRTDHHWNFEGAFAAYTKVVELVKELFPGLVIDDMYTDISMWEAHTVKDISLGSLGKRVGTLYAGIDDVTYYTPSFETSEISLSIPDRKVFYKGDFFESSIKADRLEGDPDYFNKIIYGIYTCGNDSGGNDPLVQHRNPNAPAELRMLIIRDSYVLPVEAYLSTVFTEIDTIDPRYFTETSIAEYAKQFRPDIVITMIHSSYGPKSSMFGKLWENEGPESKGEEIIAQTRDYEIPAVEDGGFNSARIATLEPERRYTVTFSEADVLAGNAEGVMLRVYDAEKKEVIASRIFDAEYYRSSGGVSWTFDTGGVKGKEILLLAYAGIAGKTQGISVKYKDLTLTAH